MTATFVGRDVELAALEALTRRVARGGMPAAAVILGDPGAGKTRLLDEAAAASTSIETQLRLTGYEPEQQLAFAAVRDLARPLARDEEGGRLEALLSGDPAGALQPLQIFEWVRRAVEHLDAAVILVDDLQWVDASSMALLHYLVRSAEQDGFPLGLLAAARPSPAVGSFAESLRRSLGDRFLSAELGALDRASGIRMVQELAPHLTSADAARAWRRAEGVPFWLELVATGEGSEADAGRFLTERLRGASKDASSLLAVIAVAGRPIQEEEAADVNGWEVDRARAAIAELHRAGLAASGPEGVGAAHDLIRVAVLSQIADDRTASLHGRLAERLERRAGDDPLSLLRALDHRRAGNLPTEDLALRLLRSPRRRLLGQEGVRNLARLVEEADPHSPITTDLYGELATLAGELGAHPTALELWSALVDRRSEPGSRAPAALGAARAAFELERREETWSFLRRARDLVPGDPALAVEIDALQATVLRWMDRRPEQARAAADRAIEGAHALGAGELPAATRTGYLHALAALNDAALQDDDPSRMVEISEEIVEAARDDDEPAYLRALTRGGFALFSLGRSGEAELRLRTAWNQARAGYLHGPMVDAGFWLARTLLAWGRVLEAEEVASEVATIGHRVGYTSRQVHNWLQAARMARGDWASAVEALRREAAGEQDPHFRLALQLSVAAGLSRLDPIRARAEVSSRLVAGREDAEAVGCGRCWGELILRGAEARARVGDEQGSARWIDDWEAGHRPSYPVAAWWRRRAMASLAVARGLAEAVPALESVLTEADQLGLRLESAWAGIDLATVVAASDVDRATGLLTAAVEVAGSLGAATEQRVAQQALRGLGVRAWRRGAASAPGEGLAQLSERERQVARLAASGASNPEIAQTLFVSRKTVERHVSNVLGKLRVRNRTELASLIASSGEGEDKDEGAPR